MLRVDVLFRGVSIGRSDLLAADPPMGVAIGALSPVEAYEPIRERWAVFQKEGWVSLQVDIRTLDGLDVVCQGGAFVADRPEPSFDESPELNALGIGKTEYREWFGSDPAYVTYYRDASSATVTPAPTDPSRSD